MKIHRSRSARLYAIALPVECPYCGAMRNIRCAIEPCGAEPVRYSSRPHQARLDAARVEVPMPSLADVVSSRNADLEQALARIESACGIPNPAEACRTILALCRDAEVALSAAPATGKEWPC